MAQAGLGVAGLRYAEHLQDARRGSVSSAWQGAAAVLSVKAGIRQGIWWLQGIGAYGAVPAYFPERWQMGRSVQRNELTVQWMGLGLQLGVELWRGAYGFFSLAWSREEQRRRRFFSNGVPVHVPGEPVHERVQAVWQGVGVGWRGAHWQVELQSEQAARADAINSLYGRFDTKRGHRYTARLAWRQGSWQMMLNWQKRTLAGGRNGLAIWPPNRFESFTLGVDYRFSSSR